VSTIPVYFSHSYRREDRDVNDHFWHIFHDAGFSFTVDPGTTSFFPTALELMMARSVGFAAVVTYRDEEERYQCSPFIMHEYGLAVQAQRPRLVLRDKRVPPRNFESQETLSVEFDVAALGRCTHELKRQLHQFRIQASGRLVGHRYRRGHVGVAIQSRLDAEQGNGEGRWARVEDYLDKRGCEPVDLVAIADDPWQLAQAADACDFAIIDIDDSKMSGIADFLLGRGTPLLKVARRNASPITPSRLLGSAPLRRATAADELVMYWTDQEDFESRIRQQISRAMTDRTEFTDLNTGHRYFRSLGREVKPVFVSNAAAANGLARELANSLILENIPFFHYRYQNPIGLGEQWTHQLERMVAVSKVFLPLIDDSYWASEYCRREYEAASRLSEAGRITIFPCLLPGYEKGPEIPYQGEDLCYLSPPEQVNAIVNGLDELLAAKNRAEASDVIGPLEAGRTSVDVAIITILEEEYEAVLRLLRRVRQVIGSATLDNQHAWVVGEVDVPASPVPYTVALAMSPRAGTNAAVIATKNTIRAFDPRCVLVVGVAGGLGDVSLGDVVVADRICAYEYGKVDRGFHPRHDLDSPTDAAITSAARTLAARYPDWYSELVRSEGLMHLSPQITVGKVASGDKVVDDTTDEFFASVTRSRDKLRAVEMEGAGAAAAIQDAREMQQTLSFGMVRGISDLPRPGGSRPGDQPGVSGQTEMRDSWKVAAASVAAAAAIQLIRLSWPRPPRAGSQRD
jgi:nucleoside phosphorylase